jgi:adenylate cyclase
MLRTLETLHVRWQARGAPRLELGIGINTGPMIVGNMGSLDRLAYTVLGDAVNLSSRLEGLSKLYGVRVVVGARTRESVGDEFVWRPLDRVAVKGRDEAVEILELMGDGKTTEETRAFVADWEEAIRLYRGRQWAKAATLFDALGARAPDDGPSRLYRARARSLVVTPPGDDWDGVYHAETK